MYICIARRDVLREAQSICPVQLNYKFQIDKQSLYNTPPCYNIYMVGLVLKWITSLGGLKAIGELNQQKSDLLYSFLDTSPHQFYRAYVQGQARSRMNVVFSIYTNNQANEKLNAQLVQEAEQNGFVGIGGHRSVGGLRVSLYNAITLEAVHALILFLKNFQTQHDK